MEFLISWKVTSLRIPPFKSELRVDLKLLRQGYMTPMIEAVLTDRIIILDRCCIVIVDWTTARETLPSIKNYFPLLREARLVNLGKILSLINHVFGRCNHICFLFFPQFHNWKSTKLSLTEI